MARLVTKQPSEEAPLNFDFGSLFGVDNPSRIVALRDALTSIGAASTLGEAQTIASDALAADLVATGGRSISSIDDIAATPTGDADDLDVGTAQVWVSSGMIAQTTIKKGRDGVRYHATAQVTLDDGQVRELDGTVYVEDT